VAGGGGAVRVRVRKGREVDGLGWGGGLGAGGQRRLTSCSGQEESTGCDRQRGEGGGEEGRVAGRTILRGRWNMDGAFVRAHGALCMHVCVLV
jgi:hypothetical protein